MEHGYALTQNQEASCADRRSARFLTVGRLHPFSSYAVFPGFASALIVEAGCPLDIMLASAMIELPALSA